MSKELFRDFAKSILDIETQNFQCFTYQSPDVKVGLYTGDIGSLVKKSKCPKDAVSGQKFEVTGNVTGGEFHLGHLTQDGSDPKRDIWFKPDLGKNLSVTLYPYTGHFDTRFRSCLSPCDDVGVSFSTEKRECSASVTKRFVCNNSNAELSFGMKNTDEKSSFPFRIFANCKALVPGGAKLTTNLGEDSRLNVGMSLKAGSIDIGGHCRANMNCVCNYLLDQCKFQGADSGSTSTCGGCDGSCKSAKANTAVLVARVPISPANLVVVPKFKLPVYSADVKISNSCPFRLGGLKNLMFALRVRFRNITDCCVPGFVLGSSFNVSPIVPLRVRCSLGTPKGAEKSCVFDTLEGRLALDLNLSTNLTASMYMGSKFEKSEKSQFYQFNLPESFGVSLKLTKSD